MANPILKELHDVRDEILAEHREDLTEFFRKGLAETKAGGHPVAKIQQRSIKSAKSSELVDVQSSSASDS